jgi:probable phosphoglycerate mutase
VCDIHLGDADGLSWSEYDARYGRFNLVAEPSRPFAPGAERWSEVTQRVRGCLEELAVRNAGKTVVAVTHAGFSVSAHMLKAAALCRTRRCTRRADRRRASPRCGPPAVNPEWW